MRSTRKIFFSKLSSGRLTFIRLSFPAKNQDQDRGHDEICHRKRQKELPSELHQLIVAIARPTRPEPQVEVKEDDNLTDEPDNAGDKVEKRELRNSRKRAQPAAPEERHRHRCHCKHV